jgi:cytochrome c oxidase subunit 2
VRARPQATRLPPLVLAAAVALTCVTGCGGGGGGSGSKTPTPAGTAKPARTAAAGGGGGEAAQGKALYASKGCQSCHSIDGSSGAGPTWKGLAGSKVKLNGGSSVTADTTYLTTSIEDPDKQIVSGFSAGVMSGSVPKGSISAADAKALVAYIETLH